MLKWIYTIIFYPIALCTFAIGGITTFVISIIIPSLLYPLIKVISKIFLIAIGIKLKISGKIPKGGPFIIMANHGSMIDPFLWGAFMKGKFTGIIAKKNLKYPIYGWLLRKMNAIPIDRKDRKNSILGIQEAERIIKKGFHIGIHPEGTRTLNGKMNKFKKGGFHMAINTKIPIVPVGINGAFNFKPKNRITINPGKITVKIGDPISNSIYDKITMDELILLTENKIKELCGETDGN